MTRADERDRRDRVYLVDASLYVFRAWFSMPDTLSDREGRLVNAVYGFYDFVMRFLRRTAPRQIVFAFDESLETSYRNDIYPPYKANREPAPDELKAQFRRCRELVGALGIGEVADARYEADDLIGALALRARDRGDAVVIVSGDKDLAQLVREGDTWWDYPKRGEADGAAITERFGVGPEQISDLLAVTGDPVDNVPGVPGVGPVTASRLLRHFGSVAEMLERVAEIADLEVRGAKRVEGLVREYAETIRLAHRLTMIDGAAPLPRGLSCEVAPGNRERLQELSDELGFGRYRRRQWQEYIEARAPPPGTRAPTTS